MKKTLRDIPWPLPAAALILVVLAVLVRVPGGSSRPIVDAFLPPPPAVKMEPAARPPVKAAVKTAPPPVKVVAKATPAVAKRAAEPALPPAATPAATPAEDTRQTPSYSYPRVWFRRWR
jgi:hypothetical protein